jgi:hypothetical protein
MRTGPEQRGTQELPIGQRSRLRNDNPAARLLPAAGRYLSAKLIFCHESESQGRAEDAFVLGEHVVKAVAMGVHALSVMDWPKFAITDFKSVDNPLWTSRRSG